MYVGRQSAALAAVVAAEAARPATPPPRMKLAGAGGGGALPGAACSSAAAGSPAGGGEGGGGGGGGGGRVELLVFGYACKLFRDDEKALQQEQGRHLIPWMGETSIMIDRSVPQSPPARLPACLTLLLTGEGRRGRNRRGARDPLPGRSGGGEGKRGGEGAGGGLRERSRQIFVRIQKEFCAPGMREAWTTRGVGFCFSLSLFPAPVQL